MPEPLALQKAELIELRQDFSGVNPDGKRVEVQFNPESLKLSFANQIKTDEGEGSQTGTAGQLFVGQGTTRLALQLWFDVTQPGAGETDVRKLTQRVAHFLKPGLPNGKGRYTPYPVRFQWGTFGFDGIMESMEETLDYWSHDGRPLRASVSLSFTQQKIDVLDLANRGAGGASTIGQLVGNPGTKPLAEVAARATLQAMADQAGRGVDWKAIAAANGVDDPRHLEPGQLLDLDPSRFFGS